MLRRSQASEGQGKENSNHQEWLQKPIWWLKD